MKLKTRIIVSFFIIILEPLLFTGVAFWGFSQYQLKAIEKQYGIENATYESLTNTAEVINSMTSGAIGRLSEAAKESPKDLENIEYLDSINKELEQVHSYLIVREDDKIRYIGCDPYPSELISRLPDYKDDSGDSSDGFYLGGKIKALVKQIDFETSEHGKGSLFVVSSVFKTLPQIEELIRNMLAAVVIILTVTALGLTWWIYRGVISPLDKLRTATQKIKEGNLDFSIASEGVNEISDLCQDFEAMRQRLKENAEEKLEFDKDNKELISNISHDLKTPITAIKGYVEGILDGVASSPEKLDKYIRTIYNKSNDMDRLIDELTFYSKIDTNKIPYTFSKINVAQYFRDCVEEVGLDMEARGIELGYFNYVDEDVVIIADAEQMKRVMNNIISNSVKYLDKKKGIINIRIKDVGDFIQVEIEDNGKGIAAKDLPNIFDRFYRTDSSRNSAQGGSGIGLSIVRKIVEDHGGRIWATSKEGIGTEIHFVLRKYQEVLQDEQDSNRGR